MADASDTKPSELPAFCKVLNFTLSLRPLQAVFELNFRHQIVVTFQIFYFLKLEFAPLAENFPSHADLAWTQGSRKRVARAAHGSPWLTSSELRMFE